MCPALVMRYSNDISWSCTPAAAKTVLPRLTEANHGVARSDATMRDAPSNTD
jgi:hypothetical protein